MTGPWWIRQLLVEPLDELFRSLAVGERLADPDMRRDPCRRLALGVEAIVRDDPAFGFAATTDGFHVGLCRRSGDDTVLLIGTISVDFSTEVVAFRAEIRRERAPDAVAIVGWLGQVDERTGRPSRLPGGTLVVPVGPDVELLAGRRQVPVNWTRSLEARVW